MIECLLRPANLLGRFDNARPSYLYKEAGKEQKVERYQLGEAPPPICTALFMVDKKGNLMGRKVRHFTLFNQVSEEYCSPTPNAEVVLMNACGKSIHAVFDCAWGSSQTDSDEETANNSSTITEFRVFNFKNRPDGCKQGPSIYQHMQDSVLGDAYKEHGEKMCGQFRIWGLHNWRILEQCDRSLDTSS